jgi:hypothetical protein
MGAKISGFQDRKEGRGSSWFIVHSWGWWWILEVGSWKLEVHSKDSL